MNPEFPIKSGAYLSMARNAAAKRYSALGSKLLASIGLAEPTTIRRSLTGFASRRSDGTIRLACPWPTTTRRRLYVCAHEVAHIVLHYTPSGKRIKKPRHMKEHEAELWAHRWLRDQGIAVPRQETERAKNYVASKIEAAIRNGAMISSIARPAAAWAGVDLHDTFATRITRLRRGAALSIWQTRRRS